MKLTDYINECLKDPEFRKYWENADFSFLDKKSQALDKREFEKAKSYMKMYMQQRLGRK